MLSKRTFEYWQVMVRTERGVVRRLRVEYLTEILEVLTYMANLGPK